MKRALSFLLAIVLVLGLVSPVAAESDEFRIIAPEKWELCPGESRTLDYAFSAGITDRMLEWSSSDESVATVDKWGRVTAVAPGTATITAKGYANGSVDLTVVEKATGGAGGTGIVNFSGEAVEEVPNLQKIVTRYSSDEHGSLPLAAAIMVMAFDFEEYQTATTADGAKWEITSYGVLRTDENAPTERDKEMRFMGDRYFYISDTTTDKVMGIVADDGNGIWTLCQGGGVTHIEMVEMSGYEKAALMSDNTQEYVSRRGMVAEAYWNGTEWVPRETDNDGLWTAMYGVGEVMRYAVLRDAYKKDPNNSELKEMADAARKTAMLSTEAVLFLSNVSMRDAEVESYVRYISDGGYVLYGNIPVYNETGKNISEQALLADGDYSMSTPDFSPAKNWTLQSNRPLDADSWADPRTTEAMFAKRTRNLSGFIARTYSLHGEAGGNADTYSGEIYYDFADYSETNKTAVGKSQSKGVVNGEDLKGVRVDASGEIPARLWNDLLGSDVKIQDIVYKGDTSTDEIIGHLFIYKVAYDVFKDEDPELAKIIADTMDRFAQHLSDNEYMLVDATGQPTTWGKMNRQYFYTYRWGAPSSPLTSSVLLAAFKVAAHTTGYKKWEDEYRLLLNNGAYLYGDVMDTHTARDEEFLNKYAAPLLGDTLGPYTLTQALDFGGLPAMYGMGNLPLTAEKEFLARMFAQYSDEEMAALAFYLLFQLEEDEDTLAVYREAIDQWWEESYKYSENPFVYYVYQLAYPDKTIIDAYGNNILETAAWSLSRHPVDTRRWNASNSNRDDIMIFDLEDYSKDLATRGGLSVKKTALPPTMVGADGIIGILLLGGITYGQYDLTPLGAPLSGTLKVEYAVAAPDERAIHKFNNSTYILNDDNPNCMEGSTTYTLPYWMGVYHHMLEIDLPYEGGEAPEIMSPTEDQTIELYAGEDTELEVVAEGAETYEWFVDRGNGWELVEGADNPVFETGEVTLDENGWRFFCRVSNAYGSADSPVFTLKVTEKRIPDTGDSFGTVIYVTVMLAAMAGFIWNERRRSVNN